MKKRMALHGMLMLVLIITGMEIAPAISAAFTTVEPEEMVAIPIESLPLASEARKVALNQQETALLDSKRQLEMSNFVVEEDDDYFDRYIGDASTQISDSEFESKQALELYKIQEVLVSHPTELETYNVTKSVEEVKINGLLDHVIHVVNGTSSGNVYLDSQGENYQLNGGSVVKNVVDNRDVQPEHDQHFGMVVFVSDYRSRSIAKLQENQVWLQTYSRLEAWLRETTDYHVMLVNEYATPDNIMGILAAAEQSRDIKSIGITFVAHGVNSIYGHGILIHHNDEPKELGVMDGRIFQAALDRTGVEKITKLIHTNMHSCYLIDEYERYGEYSVLGFFEKQNPHQVLTGYRGLTYLNTRFVLSLENLLSAGTYVLPQVTKTLPGMLTVNNNTQSLGEVNYIEKTTYEIVVNDNNLASQYVQQFEGDETLFVNDINHSPATGESTYYDPKVYEHLSTSPPSFFPIAGVEYSFEGHRSGAWADFVSLNDDNYFYYAKGQYGGLLEEFGLTQGTSYLDTSYWSGNAAVTMEEGYAKMEIGTLFEDTVTNRPTNSEFTILFTVGYLDDGDIEFHIQGTRSPDSLHDGADTGNRDAFLDFRDDGTTYDIFSTYMDWSTLVKSDFDLIKGRPYHLTITISAGVAHFVLTTPDDPDFSISAPIYGVADMLNPKLLIATGHRELWLDMVQITPIFSSSANPPQMETVYEDDVIEDRVIQDLGAGPYTVSTRYNGKHGVEANLDTNYEWSYVSNVKVDESNRYLGMAAKINPSATSAKIVVYMKQSAHYFTPRKHYVSMNFLKDDNWHYYVIDLYKIAGYGGYISQIAFRSSHWNTYFDSVYVSSSLSALMGMEYNGVTTDQQLPEYNSPIGFDPENDANLLLLMKFDGNSQDSSPSGYHATHHGGGYYDADDYRSDKSYHGTGGYFTYSAGAALDFNPSKEYTISWWHQVDQWRDPPWSSNYQFSGLLGQATTRNYIDLEYRKSDGYVRIHMEDNADNNYLSDWLTSFDAKAWHHYAIVMSDGNTRFYVDGELAGITSSLSTWLYAYTLGAGYSGTHLYGLMDEVYIFERVLDPVEINYLREKDSVRAHYTFNGHTSDDSGNGNTVTPTSSPTYTTGRMGQAYYSNGNYHMNNFPDGYFKFYKNEEYTISWWQKVHTWQDPPWSSSFQFAGVFGNGGTNGYLDLELRESTGLYRIHLEDDAGNHYYSDWITHNPKVWHHYSVMISPVNTKFYVDGVLINSDQKLLDTISFNRMGSGYAGRNLKGYLDDLTIFDRQVHTEEIEALYQLGDIRMYYSFDGDIEDTSGNENTGVSHLEAEFKGGKVGSAYWGSGANYIKNFPNGGLKLDLNHEYTISWWQKVDAWYSPTWGGYYAGVVGDGTTDTFISLESDNNGNIRIYMQDDGDEEYESSWINLNASNWHHYSVVVTPTYTKFFVDGTYVSQNIGLGHVANFLYMASGYPGGKLSGYLDEFYMYNIALTDDEIETNFWSHYSPHAMNMNVGVSLESAENPTYTMSSTIYNIHTDYSKLMHFMIKINGDNYAVRLENDVWKSNSAGTISDLNIPDHISGTSYTFEFYIYDFDDTGTTKKQLQIWMTHGANNERVLALSKVFTSVNYADPSIRSYKSYAHDSSLFGGAGLGSVLYTNNAAQGSVTQGAFALDFGRKTYLESVDVTDMYTYHNGNLLKLLDDYKQWRTCAGLFAVEGKCYDKTSYIDGGHAKFYSPEFMAAMMDPNIRGFSMTNWNADKWFEFVMHATGEISYIAGDFNNITEFTVTETGGKYYFYYNKPLTSLDAEIRIEGTNGENFRLDWLDGTGQTLDTFSSSTYPFVQTITVNPQDPQFFYFQTAHDAQDPRFRISITPTNLTYNRAYIERYSGEQSSLSMVNTFTGGPSANLAATSSPVSYIQYRLNDTGSPAEPIYDELSFESNKYYLHRMTAIGSLPQTGQSNDLSANVDLMTYGKSEGGGERLVGGQTYWGTEMIGERQYEVKSHSYGTLGLTDNHNYMFSFGYQSRYSGEITITLYMTDSSDAALYYNGEESIAKTSEFDSGSNGQNKAYVYTFYTGGGIDSFLIKMNAENQAYTREEEVCELVMPPDQWECETVYTPYTENAFILVKITGTPGTPGYYTLVDDVEEFRRSLLYNNYLTNLIQGWGFFDNNVSNEKLNASIPSTARPSLDDAANANPTENRVFDVMLLLEKIVEDFGNLRDKLKKAVYDNLVWEADLGFTEIKKTDFADFLWHIIEEYGFRSVERVINWFGTEERQNRLANIILGDTTLQEELNLNTPDNPNYDDTMGLNYLGVAKVGILVYADYIHDTYIAGGPSWALNTWYMIMGILPGFNSSSTLVDIVSTVFDGVNQAISAIKDAANAIWEGIKSGAEFVLDKILKAMIDVFIEQMKISVRIIKSFIDVLNVPGFVIQEIQDGFSINNEIIKFIRNDIEFQIHINDRIVSLGDIFFSPQIETLSLVDGNDDVAMMIHELIVLSTIGATSPAIPIQAELVIFLTGLIAHITFFVFEVFDYMISGNEDSKDYALLMGWNYFLLFLETGLAGLTILKGTGQAKFAPYISGWSKILNGLTVADIFVSNLLGGYGEYDVVGIFVSLFLYGAFLSLLVYNAHVIPGKVTTLRGFTYIFAGMFLVFSIFSFITASII